jgi:hypothetical protein
MEYPYTNLRYYSGGLGETMKNFTQDSQRSGHVSSSLVKYILCLDDLEGERRRTEGRKEGQRVAI